MEWRLEYDYEQLRALGVSTDEISQAVGLHYQKEFLGTYDVEQAASGKEWIRLVLMPEHDNREFDAGQIQVKVKDGRIIRLDELVKVVRMEEQPQSYYRINGLNSIYLSVVAEEAANQLELSKKEFRRLLDMVYIGNWILNSTRGEDRFRDYDQVESLLFEKARQEGMPILAETYRGETVPSRAFVEGGIHEAIMEYENNVFFDILAEDLARRDMNDAPIDETNCEELAQRIETYINEFEENGTDNILVDLDTTT